MSARFQTLSERAAPPGDASAKGLTAKGRATRSRIVEAAARLMLDRGAASATIEEIQHEAGVSASQLYHYFTDKQALLYAVIDHESDVMLAYQARTLGHLDSWKSLEAWREAVVADTRKHHGAGGCPIGTLLSDVAETDPIARRKLARAFARWEQLLRDGLASMRERGELRPETDTDQLALALLASAQGGLLLSQARRDVTPLMVALDTSLAYVHTWSPPK